jgi:hypothetical protein
MGVLKLVIGAGAAVVVAATALVAGGFVELPWSSDSVPCAELASSAKVQAALAEHSDLVKKLEQVGARLSVEPQKRCSGDANYAIVIKLPSVAKAAVDGILNSTGFGVYGIVKTE